MTTEEILECDIQPRPLEYSLKEYHVAMSSGPLHFTWIDKPHRLVYDLIAAVKHYAALVQTASLSDEQVKSLEVKAYKDGRDWGAAERNRLNQIIRADTVWKAQIDKTLKARPVLSANTVMSLAGEFATVTKDAHGQETFTFDALAVRLFAGLIASGQEAQPVQPGNLSDEQIKEHGIPNHKPQPIRQGKNLNG